MAAAPAPKYSVKTLEGLSDEQKKKVKAAAIAASAVKTMVPTKKKVRVNPSVTINEASAEDPTKPKSGTMKGVQAAEIVHRRRIEHQYMLNPMVWYLKLLIAWRNEVTTMAKFDKALLYQDAAADSYATFVRTEESFERHLLTVTEFDEGSIRLGIESEQLYRFRWLTYGFIDRLDLIKLELQMRERIASNAVEGAIAIRRQARGDLNRQNMEQEVEDLFHREQDQFLARFAVLTDEFSSRFALESDGLEDLSTIIAQALSYKAHFDAETAARNEIEAEEEAGVWPVLEDEYARCLVMEDERVSRGDIEQEIAAVMDELGDSLQQLLDVFYEERAEEERQQLEAERRRKEAAELAYQRMLEQHHLERKSLEEAEERARANPVPPERKRVKKQRGAEADNEPNGTPDADDARSTASSSHHHPTADDDASEASEEADDDKPSKDGDAADDDFDAYEWITIGDPLGIEPEQERVWADLLEVFEAERWALEETLASEAQQRQRILDVALTRKGRVEADEKDARRRLYATIEEIRLAADAVFKKLSELCDEEEQQRGIFEWAEVESRAAIARKFGVRAKPSAASTAPAPQPASSPTPPREESSAPPQTLTPEPSVVAPAPAPQQAGVVPAQVASVPPGAQVVYVQGAPGQATMPYPASPHYRLPARSVTDVMPNVGAPLPYDKRVFKRTGAHGEEVSADLQAAEDEVEAMVNAATLPLGILEYELRSKWLRTKQQLISAVQDKLLEPLHQLAAELPDGEDIVKRARATVPPRSLRPVTPPSKELKTAVAQARREAQLNAVPSWAGKGSPPRGRQRGDAPDARSPPRKLAPMARSQRTEPPASNTPPPGHIDPPKSPASSNRSETAPPARSRRTLQPLSKSQQLPRRVVEDDVDVAERDARLRQQVIKSMQGMKMAKPARLPGLAKR